MSLIVREHKAPPEYRYKEFTDVVGFGKHKGSTIESILDNDPEWLKWAALNIPRFKLSRKIEEAVAKRLDELDEQEKEEKQWQKEQQEQYDDNDPFYDVF